MNRVHKNLYRVFLANKGTITGDRYCLYMNYVVCNKALRWTIYPRITRDVNVGAEFLYRYAILTQE